MPEHTLLLINLVLLFALKIICFAFGFLIVKIGSALLREGVSGNFKFNTSFSGATADLASASPGLLFLVLGTGLIGYAIWVDKIPSEVPVQQTPFIPPNVTIPSAGETHPASPPGQAR